jgi:hypothetical protein
MPKITVCHPERSKPIRLMNRFAESKDPFDLRATTIPARHFCHSLQACAPNPVIRRLKIHSCLDAPEYLRLAKGCEG